MPDTAIFDPQVNQVLVAPLVELLQQIGESLINSQIAIDEYARRIALDLQQMEDVAAQVLPPRFAIPEVQVEMNLALEYYQRWDTQREFGHRVLFAAPLNAQAVNLFNYNVEGSSRISLRFAAIPNP